MPSHARLFPPTAWQGFLAFQTAWFATVMSAAQGHALWGCGILWVVLICHVAGSSQPMRAIGLIGVFCLLGVPVEWLNQWVGGFQYVPGDTASGTTPEIPYWVMGLWGLLAMGLRYARDWLQQRYALAAILGAVAGPASIDAGIRLGAGHYLNRPLALSTLALLWCLATPLLLWLTTHMEPPNP